MAFTERLQDFFAVSDFAVAATWTPSSGGPQKSADVLLDSPDETMLDHMVMSTEYVATMIALDFLGLKGGETIAVAGVNYKVREVLLLDDGGLKHATLSKL